jgi:uncharacterized RDD family membrane protein YckC
MIYGGFWFRGIAFVVDLVLLNVAGLIPQYLLAQLFGLSPFNEQILGEGFSLAIYYWYYCHYQVRTGTTVGKKIFSIYVLNEKTGGYLTRTQAIVRLIAYLPSMLLFGCGFLMAAFHPQKKTLHDLIAGTVCVRRPKAKIAAQEIFAQKI